MSDGFQPTALEMIDEKTLRIHWDDGKVLDYAPASLRKACPCASCREKSKSEDLVPARKMQILSASEAAPLRIASMRPVGNYAYNIGFSDQHSSGIYSLELLRNLGTEPKASPHSH